MNSAIRLEIPESYAEAKARIELHPFGLLPSRVRHLGLLATGSESAYPALLRVSEQLNLLPLLSCGDKTVWLSVKQLQKWGGNH